MADPTFDYAQGDKPVASVPHRVFRKPTYATAEWTPAPTVDLLGVVDGANAIAEIQLRAVAGDILREGKDEYAYESIDDWMTVGTFVLVEFYDLKNNGDPDFTKVLERWIGVVVVDGQDPMGKHGGGTAADQTILARGCEHLLAQTPVLGSVVNGESPAGDNAIVATLIDVPMTFNAPRAGMAKWDRNRASAPSTTQYLGPPASPATRPIVTSGGAGASSNADSTPTAVYAFEQEGESTKQWNLVNVLNYLLAFFGPPVATLGKTFTFDTMEHLDDPSKLALLNSLHAYVIYGFAPERMSLFDCLNALLNPARGLAWKLVYSDDARAGTAAPTIAIFSIQAADVTVGSQTMPRASDHDDVVVTGLRNVKWQVRNEQAGSYGRIVVRGEYILSCFSLSKLDATLAKGWTSQEEAEYATPTGLTSGSADYDVKLVRFRARSRAWTEYVPVDHWDFKVKNGENAGAGTLVNPRCADDGALVETPRSRARWHGRFENFVPIEVALPEGATKPDTPTYQEMLVFAKATTDGTGGTAGTSWFDLKNNLDATVPQISYVGALHERLGVRVRTDPNDLLSPSPVSPDAASVTSWEKMIVTVSMRTESRVSVAANIADGDPMRVLTIDVNDVELWLVAPQTVVGVKPDGTLDRYPADPTKRAKRDDRDRLKRVLALATAWFGQRRRPVAMQFDAIVTRLPSGTSGTKMRPLRVGTMIDHVVDTDASAEINTVISDRRFDVERNGTALSTGFGYQPEFANFL